MKKLFAVVLVCAAMWAAFAVETPKLATTLTDIAQSNLLSAYKSYVIAQTAFNQAQQNLQNKAAAYNALYEKSTATLPKGSKINVDILNDTVTVELPKTEEKPESKK